MDNLIKVHRIIIPWSEFRIVDGGTIVGRYLVETKRSIPFSEFGIDGKYIVSLTVCGGYGYSEYVQISPNNMSFMCGQILSSAFHKESEGNMSILILSINNSNNNG